MIYQWKPQNTDGIDNVSTINDDELLYQHQTDPNPFIPPLDPINDAYNIVNHNAERINLNVTNQNYFWWYYQIR